MIDEARARNPSLPALDMSAFGPPKELRGALHNTPHHETKEARSCSTYVPSVRERYRKLSHLQLSNDPLTHHNRLSPRESHSAAAWMCVTHPVLSTLVCVAILRNTPSTEYSSLVDPVLW